MQTHKKKLLALIYFLITLLVSSLYKPAYIQAVCSPNQCNAIGGCGPTESCTNQGSCCTLNDPPPGGCTGPSQCGSSECCVQGACEPKNGSSCSSDGSLSCPGGTQPNPISPFPGCTATGNCCCAVAQLCPGTITCGTSVTVPNGQCGLITCNGPVCPTTPPGGCSSNPSSCGVGKCCNSNVCGNCPSTPPPATTPPVNYISGRIYNDTNNNCSSTAGWTFFDPLSGYNGAYVTVNIPAPTPIGNTGIIPPSPIFFGIVTTFSNVRPASNGNTIYLTGLPAGYRCSDCNTGTCPIRTGVTSPSNNNNFYITNAAASPTPPPALSSWWQVEDGDVTTDGDIVSSVPTGQYFGTLGAGGFAGVPIFGGTFNLVLQNAYDKISAATSKWNVNTTTEFTRIFDYSYFENLVPDDVVLNDVSTLATGTGASTYSDGYQWYKVTGNHTISSDIDLGSRKVILFVKSGNLNINSRINLDDDSGFFGAFVNGSIVVSPTLTGTPAIEGIYLTDNSFSSGAGSLLFHARGSLASFGPITLGRNLSNNATAAELFQFAPDQVALFPEKLRYKKTKWTEVAP